MSTQVRWCLETLAHVVYYEKWPDLTISSPDLVEFSPIELPFIAPAQIDHSLSSLTTSPIFLAQPPAYPPLAGRSAVTTGSAHNLFTHFLNFSDNHDVVVGVVYELNAVRSLEWTTAATRQA